MLLKRQVTFYSIVLFVLLAFLIGNVAFASAGFVVAPTNPAFIEHLQKGKIQVDRKNTLSAYAAREGGLIPMPIDFSHLRSADYAPFLKDSSAPVVRYYAELNPTYDLRVQNRLTDVRDQNPFGACWSFAALASAESIYKKNTQKDVDLSEMHLAWFSYMDDTGFTQNRELNPLNEGGHSLIAAAVLSRWTGAALEQTLPYPIKGNFIAPPKPATSYPSTLHIQDVYMLSLSDRSVDKAVLKKLIVNQGAVAVGIEYTDDFFNVSTNSYYHSGSRAVAGTGHMVALVGWDDKYPRESFVSPDIPATDGAWLVRNSWGPNWGDGGYFWIAYSDATLQNGSVFVPEEKGNYDRIYAHDPLGMTRLIGPNSGALSMSAANRFIAREDSTLEAVSFYTTDANAQYEISVYKNTSESSPISGALANTPQKGAKDFAGYYTIKLNTPIALLKGESFSIVVKFTNSVSPHPIAVESPVVGYSDQATSAPGQSFVSWDGSTWSDLSFSETLPNTNVTIKAFTKYGSSGENAGNDNGRRSENKTEGTSSSGGGCNAFGGVALLLPVMLVILRRKG